MPRPGTPTGGTIDHRLVRDELIDLSHRFAIQEVAYDPPQIHMLAVEALSYGVPMRSVSQAAGRGGGAMARHTTTLLEALHSAQLRFFVCPELRDHRANARFSARSGGDRLVKASASKKIDLAVALAMAVGSLYDLAREQLLRPVEVYEYISAEEYLISHGIQPTDLSSEPEVSEYFSEDNWPSGNFRSDEWYDEW
jgi:phage terminase large subunit-like protein